MIEIIAAACGVYLVGWVLGRLDCATQDDWRRRFNHENIAPNSSEKRPRYWTEGRIQRGNGHGGPTTTKPQFPSPRKIPGDMPFHP